jgi:hypothetical protein
MPLGGVHLNVQRSDLTPPLPLNRVNRVSEGDKIVYTPALRPNDKRPGEVALVLVGASGLTVLDPKDADKPAEWKVPFAAKLAVHVYGPSGLSVRKLKGFLSKDQEVVEQLADYAEKTSETEAVLRAIAQFETSGSGEQLSAALQGFAGSGFGGSKLDRNAPLNQQTLAALRTLNPALSAYDPISPSASQRMSQTAGLAATVAGMFLGSTVGLAAGSTAMALNMKTILFPDTDFRSAYAQPAKENAIPLCASRDANRSRKRLAYLWAMRVPDIPAPAVIVEGPASIAPGQKMPLKLSAPKHLDRVRAWSLRSSTGEVSVTAAVLPDQRTIEVTAPLSTPSGDYKLAGLWDWDSFEAGGTVSLRPLETFASARVSRDSHDRPRQRSGKHLITVEGADFRFVQKVAFLNPADKYAAPVQLPFTFLQPGRLEVQVDTSGVAAGEYALALFQTDNQPHRVPIRVLSDPPKLTNLPLVLYEGEREFPLRLSGEGLERIVSLAAEGLRIEAKSILAESDLKAGQTLDLRMTVKDYAEPVVVPGAIRVAPPRPRIVSLTPSLPSELPISLRAGELPAGLQVGYQLRLASFRGDSELRVSCEDTSRAVSGSRMDANTVFLSFDPGTWQNGCSLSVTVGESEPVSLGRVTRIPTVDSFRLTDESVSAGTYVGLLSGKDLELIGKVGWTATEGIEVPGLPTPVGSKQSLKVHVPWPSPTPHAPLYIWLRGDLEGRATAIRY